jgi:EamA domain-containing membrane protein RarD
MLANVAANVSHLLVLRKLKLNRDLSNTQILHYSALWSLIWLVPVGLAEGVGASLRRLRHMPTSFMLVMLSTGVNSICMFLATIWCLERTSGST